MTPKQLKAKTSDPLTIRKILVQTKKTRDYLTVFRLIKVQKSNFIKY